MKRKYYEFSQNNSGGDWVVDDKVTRQVVIEADSEAEAIVHAEALGVYFDGVRNGTDCGCCGDRWSSPSEVVFPYRYGTLEKKEAEEIATKYSVKFEPTTWKFLGTEPPDPNRFDVVFETAEQKYQYLADKYGWVEPDAYIYPAVGEKVVIKKNK